MENRVVYCIRKCENNGVFPLKGNAIQYIPPYIRKTEESLPRCPKRDYWGIIYLGRIQFCRLYIFLPIVKTVGFFYFKEST